jgi:hypothetical protein
MQVHDCQNICHALQAVDRAVRIAEGGATRPVNSDEAAKGRLDYVQVLTHSRCWQQPCQHVQRSEGLHQDHSLA